MAVEISFQLARKKNPQVFIIQVIVYLRNQDQRLSSSLEPRIVLLFSPLSIKALTLSVIHKQKEKKVVTHSVNCIVALHVSAHFYPPTALTDLNEVMHRSLTPAPAFRIPQLHISSPSQESDKTELCDQ